MAEEPSVLDYREPEWVAKKLGLDKNTVYKYLQEGWLPGVQLGRKWLVSERLLAEHLEQETRAQMAARRKEIPRTPRLQRSIQLAQKYAASRGQDFCGTEHLLIGMLQEADNFGCMILRKLGVDLARAQQIFESRIPAENRRIKQTPELTDPARTVLRLAQEQAIGLGHTYIGCEAMLLGLLVEPTGMGGEILRSLGVTADSARAELLKLVQGRE